MRDRLIEFINYTRLYGDGTSESIADYLLSNGVIVPPCKVGDTVFAVSQGSGFNVVWDVYKAKAIAIHIDEFGQLFVQTKTEKENIGGYVEVERIFITQAEAEKELAERIRQ